ncbi:MAG: hypothetical protein GY816_06190 [Cytophagales bacterium]|nr:hypothetical protein [Cytophagales bacterium]
MAKIAKQVVLRNSETKRRFVQINAHTLTEGFSSHDLSSIEQGDEINQRTGRQVIATSIRKNLMLRSNSKYEPVLVRTLVLQAKQGHYADVLSSTEIFNNSEHPDDANESWDQHTAGPGKLLAMMKKIDTTRFTVKEDKLYVLGANTNPNPGTGSGDHANHDGRSCIRIVRSNINMKQKVMHYTGTGTVVGEEGATRNTCENRLHFVVMACQVDGSQITGTTVLTLGNIILYYKDP